MRSIIVLTAISLLSSASVASAATAPKFPLKLAHEEFSYSPDQLLPGCKLTSIMYTDKGVAGTFSCESKAQWDAGFTIGGDMQADCPGSADATPYVCVVHKKHS